MNSFLQELKRRNVFKIAAAYGAGAWILVSVGDILFPIVGAPAWVMKVFVLVAVLGVPIAILFAWVFELTPEGLKRTHDVAPDESVTADTGRRLNYIVIGLLVVALAVSLFLNFSLTQQSGVETVPTQASIAVLPFTSRSTDADNAVFADGIHDDLLTMLANIDSLKVISRTSVMEYRDTTKKMGQIGKELGVSTLLEGAVQRAGNNVRINVQLIDVQTDEHLWAKTYDEELTVQNIFDIQSKISGAIADALEATLTPQEQNRLAQEPTSNIEAYTLYMAGKNSLYQRGLENITRAKGQFEKAIALDPNYARAHAGLAAAVDLLWANHFAISQAEALAVGGDAISKALSLSKEDADIYAVLGLIKRNESNDDHLKPGFAEAEAAFKKALEINHNHVQAMMWYAGMLDSDDQTEAAKALYDRAMELDPLARVPRTNLMYLLSRLGNEEQAIHLALDTIDLFPDYRPSYRFLSDHLTGVGRLDEAMAWSEKALSNNTDPLAFGQANVLLREFSKFDRLAQWGQDVPEQHPLYHVVQAFMGYGQGDVRGAQARIETILTYLDKPPDFIQGLAAYFSLELGECEKARRYFGEMHPELLEEKPVIRRQNFGDTIAIAYCLQQDSQNDRAELLLKSALTYIEDLPRLGAVGFGILDVEAYALLGEPDKALSILRQAVDQGFRSGYFRSFWRLEDNVFLKPLNGDPEFDRLVTLVNQDILRMRDNVDLAEKNGDWEPLLALIKNSDTSVN